jgi:hypothetical protein
MIYLLTAIGLSPGGSTHLHTNTTQNNTHNNQTTLSAVRAPSLRFFPGICLTTEGKARKNLSQGKKNLSQGKEISVTVQYTYYQKNPHITKHSSLDLLHSKRAGPFRGNKTVDTKITLWIVLLPLLFFLHWVSPEIPYASPLWLQIFVRRLLIFVDAYMGFAWCGLSGAWNIEVAASFLGNFVCRCTVFGVNFLLIWSLITTQCQV